jgi:ABC-type nitrate/sulfonate/bicarbonate transport system permease component
VRKPKDGQPRPQNPQPLRAVTRSMNRDRIRVLAWQLLILVAALAAWQYLTGIKAISKTPGLYWIDPFFISRPSAIAERFVYLMSSNVRLSIWQMALSTVQSTVWGFLVGISTGFAAGLVLGGGATGWRASSSPTSWPSTPFPASPWCRSSP